MFSHKEYNKKRYQENKEERKKYSKKQYQKNKEKIKKKSKKWAKDNPEKVKNSSKKWRKKNPEKIKKWNKENPEYQKEWEKEHKKERKEYHKKYTKNKRKIDSKFQFNDNISSAIYQSLKKEKTGNHWETLVNYSLENLMMRLEYQFDKNMSWQNYGFYWWIDHKKPQSLFNFNSAEDQAFKDCWCLANLQPLEKIENIKKSNHFKGQ